MCLRLNYLVRMLTHVLILLTIIQEVSTGAAAIMI